MTENNAHLQVLQHRQLARLAARVNVCERINEKKKSDCLQLLSCTRALSLNDIQLRRGENKEDVSAQVFVRHR